MFLQIFRFFTVRNIVYDPFFTRKTPISESNSLMTPFFTLFVLSRASDKHYFSKYWGDGCMGRPPNSIFGGNVPLGLRPCQRGRRSIYIQPTISCQFAIY